MGRYIDDKNLPPTPTSIVNDFTVNGTVYDVINASGIPYVLSGELTANILKTILSITGTGMIGILVVKSNLTVESRTHRVKVTIDGRVVIDKTSQNAALNYQGVLAIGQGVSSSVNFSLTPVYFKQSLLIEYASSLTEANNTRIGYYYEIY